MTADRVERIRNFADRLAAYIGARNDRRFFKAVVFSERPRELRNALEKALRNEFLNNQQLLFGFDDYIQVFEADDNAGFVDWTLIRDLISIRMVEQLHAARWLAPDDLKSDSEAAQQELERVEV